MRVSPRSHRTALVGCALAGSLLLAACSGTGTGTSTGAESSLAMDAQGAPAVAGATSPDLAKSAVSNNQLQIVRTASLALTADDITKAAMQLKALFVREHGAVTSEDSQMAQDSAQSTISGQVPAASLDAFLTSASALGTVVSLSTSAYDVTSQKVDLDARISSLTASIDRLRQLMSNAANVSDLLAAEGQLASRQADLDSLTSQRSYLAQQVDMSMVSVTINHPTTANLALPIAGAALVLLILLGTTGAVVGLVVSRTYRRRQRSSSPTA